MNITCPCRQTASPKSLNYLRPSPKYQSCCGPLHTLQRKAKSADQLMRSRYSAYVFKLADYLLMSQHSDFRHANLSYEEEKANLEKSFRNMQWLGLIIHRQNVKSAVKIGDSKQAWVEFSAFFRERNSDLQNFRQVHELSSFIFDDGQWYYTEGEFLADYQFAKNETCFCSSGKKFKRCHGV